MNKHLGETLARLWHGGGSRKKEPRAKSVTIDGQEEICAVAFLVDGKHVVSGGKERKIRRWKMEDGTEAGKPMDVGSHVLGLAVSQDAKWIVSGTREGRIRIWDTRSRKKPAYWFQAHSDRVNAVDVSPDSTRIVSGSDDKTTYVWPLTCRGWNPLFDPWRHDGGVSAVKFSPNGRLIATATWCRSSVRIYDNQDGRFLVDFPIQVSSSGNQTLAWENDSRQLFALSWDGIHCLDVSTGETLSQWAVHNYTQCIAIASNGAFIAAPSGPSISFWDSVTHGQIGFITEHTAEAISAMAISVSDDIAICHGKNITLRSLLDILPSHYFSDGIRNANAQEGDESLLIQGYDAPRDNVASPEEAVQQPRDQLADPNLGGNSLSEALNLLTLTPTELGDILYNQSKDRACMSMWEEALIDADKVIEIVPMSYTGYERKHAALHGMKRYKEAFAAFQEMLSHLKESPDPGHRELSSYYVDATPTIRKVIEETIRHMPRVLIDTATGRLNDKSWQALAFEELPIYDELRSSMTTQLDYSRIQKEAKMFYRYVMFSHRWECGEPLFQRVQNTSVYNLESSSPNIKLQKFCMLCSSLGFRWVWSDTCCIDKKDNVVLQESLVAMFAWYRGSSLTVVYLRGVWSYSQQPGGLRRSIWNTRAWTYQEYVAAETVQFYTEDWKPYLSLEIFNHKESPAIISEMQQATGVLTEDLAVLRPGLDRVREKLYLASMRQTTLEEDIAYSLYGIFNVSLPVIYGEGDRAVGRFLEHILTGSGDIIILAWTGRAGSYNSCLPPDLTVYSQFVPPHVPQPIETTEMDNIVTRLRSTLSDLPLAVTLHDHLNKLPSPSIAASRLRLPGIVFPITQLDSPEQSNPETDVRMYRATTSALGEVVIKTRDDLSKMKHLVLIHPWISSLLDQEFSCGAGTLDDTTRALRLVARLRRQQFGALLLEPVSRVQYRRVAADELILAKVRDEISMSELVGAVRTVDIQ